MAILLFLLAVAGGALVGDLVLENTAPGSVTVLDRSFTGYTQGQLLAAVAALGVVVGALAVASLSLRRARRVRLRELRQTERDLTDEVAELERENKSLRGELARRDQRARRPAGAAMPADRSLDPAYDEARRVARLRGGDREP
jgi:beta-lactamase regulating signal transducer with metallopeptidase domain